jgi:hypothetical protein
MLQVYVSNVCYQCFIWILHMLHWLYTYVASVYFKYFTCFKRMLHMLQCSYTYVASICCKCSIYSDVCCSKCFTVQVFHQQARLEDIGRGGPLGRSGQAGTTAGTKHKAIFIGVAVGVEHEATFMLDCSLSLY